VLSRLVVTVFVPAASKERPDESVIELTVPIEVEATAARVAIVTSEPAPGMPAGLHAPRRLLNLLSFFAV
jgi:hypothetical protein